MQFRSPVDTLLERGNVQNPVVIPRTIVFDVWIANRDRNVGNFVSRPNRGSGPPLVDLLAIDFEKAEVLRGELDQFSVTKIDPDNFWPRGALGKVCRQFEIPAGFCAQIEELAKDSQLDAVVDQVIWDLDFPEISWRKTAVNLLKTRGRSIRTWAQEAWHG